MQRLTRERLPRFQFGHTKKEKIEKEENPKKNQKKRKIQKKWKKEKNPKRKGKKEEEKELVFSSPGQNMRLLSLPYF